MLQLLLIIDRRVFLFFNSTIANPAFDVFFTTVTNGRNWIIPGTLLAVVYVLRRRKEAVVGLCLSIVTFALTDSVTYRILKPLFERYRPCHPHYFIEGGRFLLGYNQFYSFPSNHAANAFGLAAFFFLLYPKHKYWYLAFAVAIGFSRIYVGVHWPSDVVAGAIFGSMCAAAVYYSYRTIHAAIQNRRQGDAVIIAPSDDQH